MLPHLAKYGVFDDVAIEDDISGLTFEYHVAGLRPKRSSGRWRRATCRRADLAHRLAAGRGAGQDHSRIAGGNARLVVLSGDRRRGGSREAGLHAAGRAARPGGEPAETYSRCLRIEAGTPVFGKDITEKNLPQEIGRDSRAINFVKGCYLGQETVARLDALGHVNQTAKGLDIRAGLALPGAGMRAGSRRKESGRGHIVGILARRNAPIALAMVRIKPRAAGTKVQVVLAGGTLFPRPSATCRFGRTQRSNRKLMISRKSGSTRRSLLWHRPNTTREQPAAPPLSSARRARWIIVLGISVQHVGVFSRP